MGLKGLKHNIYIPTGDDSDEIDLRDSPPGPQYENMQISVFLQPYPGDIDSDSTTPESGKYEHLVVTSHLVLKKII